MAGNHEDEAVAANNNNDDEGETGSSASSSAPRPPPQSHVRDGSGSGSGATATGRFDDHDEDKGEEGVTAKVPAAGAGVGTVEGAAEPPCGESDEVSPREGDDGYGEMSEVGPAGHDVADTNGIPASATPSDGKREEDEDGGDVGGDDGHRRSPAALSPESAPASVGGEIKDSKDDGSRGGGLRSTIKDWGKSGKKKIKKRDEATQTEEGHDMDGDGDSINRTMLHRAVSSAGRWAYGVVLVEVWVLDPRTNRLVRPDGGYWRDPVFPPSKELLRIEDDRRKDYVKPSPQGPGEGLAGILWSEMGGTGFGQRPTLLGGGGRRGGGDGSRDGIQASTRTAGTYDGGDVENQRDRRVNSSESMWTIEQMEGSRRKLVRTNRLIWRDVSFIASDPDKHPSPRLNLLAQAGFGKAAGVGFHMRSARTRGIVVYMARRSVDASRLQSPTNEAYMTRAADAVGAESALASARKASVDARDAEHAEAVRRARVKLAVLARMYRLGTSAGKRRLAEEAKKAGDGTGAGVSAAADKTAQPTESDEYFSKWERLGIVSQGKVWRDKCLRGLDVDPPPSMSFGQMCWTMVGVFATMIVLSAISVAIGVQTDREYKLLLGPFGALMTLQYSLTAAPASQPRNVMYGQAVAMTIALLFNYIPTTQLSPWLRIALVPTLAIGAMAKLGVTHPPAGASALVFAYGGYDWINFALVLMGCAVAICTATLINNLSDRRQYPTYWAFLGARWGRGYLRELLRGGGGDGDDGDGAGCSGRRWWPPPWGRTRSERGGGDENGTGRVSASTRASSQTTTSKEVELTPTPSE